MKRVLLDASVALAWCLRQEEFIPDSDVVIAYVERHTGVVPRYFWTEVRSVLLRFERRGKLDGRTVEQHLRDLRRLPLVTDDGSVERLILELSRRHLLSGYDAEYLEAAIRRDCELVTFDKALHRAGRAEHVVFDSWRTTS